MKLSTKGRRFKNKQKNLEESMLMGTKKYTG